jgi:hypothetical protein
LDATDPAPDGAEAASVAEGEVDTLEQAIRDGSTVANGGGVVKVIIRSSSNPGAGAAMCTGSLIKNNVVLTAAHCMDGFASNGGILTVEVYKTVNGQQQCITSGFPNTPGRACPTTRGAIAKWDTDYSGIGDVWHDYGVLVLITGAFANGVVSSDYLDIYDGAASPVRAFDAWGYGVAGFDSSGGGVLRSAPKYMNEYDAREFKDTDIGSNQPRMCNGDSGGPALAKTTTFTRANRVLLGTLSGQRGTGDNEICTREGSAELWNRTGTRVAQLESWIGRSCSTVYATDSGGTQRTLRRCW